MLYANRYSIPAGFIVSSRAYRNFLAVVEDRIEKLLANLNKDSTGAIPRIASEIQHLILNAEMPRDLVEELSEAYDSMNIEIGYSRNLKAFDFLKAGARGTIAIRSSLIAKDINALNNFEYATFLNVTGMVQLKRAVQACFAAIFTQKNIKYRLMNNIDFRDVSLAIIVQKMVKADKSGVLYTTNPDGNVSEAYVEAVWGLGKTLDEVYPDKYVIDKKNNKILSAQIARQSWGYYGDTQGIIVQQELPIKRTTELKLDAHNLILLSNLARELEDNYNERFKVEFGIVKDEIWLLKIESLHQEKPAVSFSVEEEDSQEDTLVPDAFDDSIDDKLKMEEEFKNTDMEKEKEEYIDEDMSGHNAEQHTGETESIDEQHEPADEGDTVLMPEMDEKEMEKLLDEYEDVQDAQEPEQEIKETGPAQEFTEDPGEEEFEDEEMTEAEEESESEESESVEFVPKAEEFSESLEQEESREGASDTLSAEEILQQASDEEFEDAQASGGHKDADGFEMKIISVCESMCSRYPHAEDALKAYRDEVLRLYRNL